MLFMLLIGTNMCCVKIYKEYARKRPLAACEPSSRFYLQSLQKPREKMWFSNQTLGKNTLGNPALRMSMDAGQAK